MNNKHNRILLTLSIAALLASFTYLFRDVLVNLVEIWLEDGNYSHGFLVPIVIGYFIWLKREELRRTPLKPFWPAAVLVLVSGLMLLAGQLAIHRFTQHFALFCMIYSLTLMVAGWRWFKILFFPMLFLVFMFPLPQFARRTITGPLQLLSSYVSVNFLQLLNYPIYREGNVLYLADTTLSVAEACSGLRSIMALMFSSAVIGYMTFTKKWKTIIPMLFAFPVAVFLNWIRITGTVVLADTWGTEKAIKFFHDFSGVVVILVSIVIITAFILFIKKREGNIEVCQCINKRVDGLAKHSTIAATALSVILLAAISVYSGLIFSNKPAPIDLAAVPTKVADYRGEDVKINPYVTSFSSVTQDRSIAYTNSHASPINLYLGYYRMERNLNGFFHGADVCLPGSGWAILKKNKIHLGNGNQTGAALMYLSKNKDSKELMITWVQNGERTQIDHRKMICTVFWNAVTRLKYEDATKVMVSTRLKNGESLAIAKTRLLDFIEKLNIQRYLI